jgi:hypothetical protein
MTERERAILRRIFDQADQNGTTVPFSKRRRYTTQDRAALERAFAEADRAVLNPAHQKHRYAASRCGVFGAAALAAAEQQSDGGFQMLETLFGARVG